MRLVPIPNNFLEYGCLIEYFATSIIKNIPSIWFRNDYDKMIKDKKLYIPTSIERCLADICPTYEGLMSDIYSFLVFWFNTSKVLLRRSGLIVPLIYSQTTNIF